MKNGYIDKKCWFIVNDIKGTHRENTPSNKTQGFAKSTNMDIWLR